MSIGSNIRKHRTEIGLTQKELADRLNYTYQAISRWENDEVEPSIDAVKEMCKIFNCSVNELLDIEENKINNETVNNSSSNYTENTYRCAHCGKIMHQPNEFIRTYKKIETIENGEHRINNEQIILCNGCYEVEEIENKHREEKKLKGKHIKPSTRRIHSFIWPSIIALGLVIGSIICFATKQNPLGVFLLIIGAFAYTFAATMILNNTFVTEMWLDIFEFGFVKMPGVIFEFSLDGFEALIVMKILLWALGIALAVAAAALATAVCMVISIFVYPFAISKNGKESKL